MTAIDIARRAPIVAMASPLPWMDTTGLLVQVARALGGRESRVVVIEADARNVLRRFTGADAAELEAQAGTSLDIAIIERKPLLECAGTRNPAWIYAGSRMDCAEAALRGSDRQRTPEEFWLIEQFRKLRDGYGCVLIGGSHDVVNVFAAAVCAADILLLPMELSAVKSCDAWLRYLHQMRVNTVGEVALRVLGLIDSREPADEVERMQELMSQGMKACSVELLSLLPCFSGGGAARQTPDGQRDPLAIYEPLVQRVLDWRPGAETTLSDETRCG